jgi:hypothetical protein
VAVDWLHKSERGETKLVVMTADLYVRIFGVIKKGKMDQLVELSILQQGCSDPKAVPAQSVTLSSHRSSKKLVFPSKNKGITYLV